MKADLMLRSSLTLRVAIVLVGILAMGSAPATAQTIGQPVRLHETDQRVNVFTTGGQQSRFPQGNTVAALAPSEALPGGGFVVTWMSLGQVGSWGIFARRFAAGGSALDVADIPVNVTTANDQMHPAVAALSGGGFVVAWMSSGQDGSHHGIFARRFAADGTALDVADIPVNVTTANDQFYPAVAALSGGGFVVAWVSSGQDGSGNGIFARRFAADGSALDVADIPVNVTTIGDQLTPSIATLPDGDTVAVIWLAQNYLS